LLALWLGVDLFRSLRNARGQPARKGKGKGKGVKKVSVNGIAIFLLEAQDAAGRDLSPHESGKVRLAQRLRVETTVTLKWIAERLRMGTRTATGRID
jgi:hypothetical protein